MKLTKNILVILALIFAVSAQSADYVVDTKSAHASVGFRFKHLNISWLTGEFNDFDGTFSYDESNPAASSVEVNIRTASIDTNHAERDKHMRSDKFLDTSEYPAAKFVSNNVAMGEDGSMTIDGEFTLHGVTKKITIDGVRIGEGKDPWGGYRAGFEGAVTLNTLDYGIELPPSSTVEIILNLEGIKK